MRERVPDPLDRMEVHQDEIEKWQEKHLPRCCDCGELILEDWLYDFEGENRCDVCWADFVEQNFVKRTEDYYK